MAFFEEECPYCGNVIRGGYPTESEERVSPYFLICPRKLCPSKGAMMSKATVGDRTEYVIMG